VSKINLGFWKIVVSFVMKSILFIVGIVLVVVVLVIVWQLNRVEDRQPVPSPSSVPVTEPVKPSQSVQVPESVDGAVESQYKIPRTVRYRFTLKNTGNRLLDKAEFWTYAPVKQTATQQVMRIDASHAHEILTDSLGNQVLHFVLANIPPYASKLVTITVELMLAQGVNSIQENQMQWFLAEEPFVEISHPEIQRLANRLKTTDDLRTSRRIFNWVARHIQYAGYIRDNRGALYALQQQRGDCTEYMYLFIALARVNGIAARGLGGYVYADDAILKPDDYHNWAEFYWADKWQLADPQNKVFMEKQSNYIAMRVISERSEIASSHRFWYSGEGLSVRMN
jgi:hypothetical protein